jgi:large subunit ribosomal protein L23
MNINIIKRPLITEKTLRLANEQNVYTFEVEYRASKAQITTAVESLFKVQVLKINTAFTASKRRRVGKKRLPKLATASKKAMVKLAEGQTIELFDVTG